MSPTWFDDILTLLKVKRALARENGRSYPLTLPERPAGERTLLAVEAALGRRLSGQYRAFLEIADGWRNLYAHVTLFGTRELMGGSLMTAARCRQTALGVNPAWLPIAFGDIDLFVMTPAGAVIWYAREEIERYPDFAGFLAAMTDANRDLITLTSFDRRYEAVLLGEPVAAFFAD